MNDNGAAPESFVAVFVTSSVFFFFPFGLSLSFKSPGQPQVRGS